MLEKIDIKLNKLMLSFLLYIRNITKKQHPLLDLEVLALSLNEKLFIDITAEQKLSIVLDTPFKNIDEVIFLLNNINKDIKTNRSITHRLTINDNKIINLSNFFTSIDGFYLDRSSSIKRLRLALLETISLLKPHLKDEVGIQAHNVRTISNLLQMLINLCFSLSKNIL